MAFKDDSETPVIDFIAMSLMILIFWGIPLAFCAVIFLAALRFLGWF